MGKKDGGVGKNVPGEINIKEGSLEKKTSHTYRHEWKFISSAMHAESVRGSLVKWEAVVETFTVMKDCK